MTAPDDAVRGYPIVLRLAGQRVLVVGGRIRRGAEGGRSACRRRLRPGRQPDVLRGLSAAPAERRRHSSPAPVPSGRPHGDEPRGRGDQRRGGECRGEDRRASGRGVGQRRRRSGGLGLHRAGRRATRRVPAHDVDGWGEPRAGRTAAPRARPARSGGRRLGDPATRGGPWPDTGARERSGPAARARGSSVDARPPGDAQARGGRRGAQAGRRAPGVGDSAHSASCSLAILR